VSAKAAKILAWAVAAQVALLAVTGIYLFYWYRPTLSAGWFGIGGNLDGSVRVEQAIKDMHALDARILSATVLALAILIAVERLGRDRLTAWLLFALSVATTFTGLLLPWDQLALWAVTVGINMHGYQPILDNQVRLVLISGAEIQRSTLIRWLIIHIALGAVAVIGAARVVWVMRSVPTRTESTA